MKRVWKEFWSDVHHAGPGRGGAVRYGAVSYATGANGLRTCPTCNGTGINPVATYLLCPKCNGEKVVKVISRG